MSEESLEILVKSLQDIHGIDAIVLGGSCCMGFQSSSSDVDICIYYNDDFRVDELNGRLEVIDDDHQPNIVLPPDSWGKWLNSGGVCMLKGIPFDFSLRNTPFVSKVIDNCIHGLVGFVYSSAYPYGYGNYYLLSETRYCKILFLGNNSIPIQKNLISSNIQTILSHVITAYLDRAIFQWICGYKSIQSADSLYLDAIFDSCLFAMINVYVSQSGHLLFHNKHFTQFFNTKFYDADANIQTKVGKILQCKQETCPHSQKFRILGFLICEEAQKYQEQLKDPNHYLVLLQLLNSK